MKRICPICGKGIRGQGLFSTGRWFHLGCYLKEMRCPECGRGVYRGKVYLLQKCPECGMPICFNEQTIEGGGVWQKP